MPSLPTGTVTFLFTDIEGSTRLLRARGDRLYAEVLEEHRRLLRSVVRERGGQEMNTHGDACCFAFPRARDALAAAIVAQRAVTAHLWPDDAAVRVRMALHTGEPLSAKADYVGMDVHRAARICAAGHGGQIILSLATRDLIEDDLPEGVSLQDLGEHRLKDLTRPQHIFQAMAPDLPVSFPPLQSLDVRPNNLPVQLTSFIGREREIADVKRLLTTVRLLTLAGAGGAGKTRLALQVAADLLGQYPEGIWFVELAPLSDPGLVPKTIASALDVPEQPGRQLLVTLAGYLRPRRLLLVLDNCEHVLSACQGVADGLLRGCPNLRILATSREPLRVEGEMTYRVPSLQLPDLHRLPPLVRLAEYEAVRLFAERAAFTQPEITLTASNALAVTHICHRLDGIPLAIEFAAARVKVLSVDQIAARLDDRFHLLTADTRKTLPRHQTLRATMDWSYDLLSEHERAVLRRLSMFAGGWTLEAAEAVCSGKEVEPGDVLDLLTLLTDKSLIAVETQGGEARYRLLETVRQYGRDRLLESGETDDVRTRHRDWYLALAEQTERELRGPRQGLWLGRLETEHDNLRAALEWSKTENDGAEAGLRLAGTLYWFWWVHGHWSEGRAWLEDALERSRAASGSSLSKALQGAAGLARQQGDYQHATALAERGLALCRETKDKEGAAIFLIILGIVASDQGEYGRAIALFEDCLGLSRELGHKWHISAVLARLATIARYRNDYGRATAFAEESLSLAKAVGDQYLVAFALRYLGTIALLQDEYQRAAESYRESLILSREVGARWVTHDCLAGLAGVACAQQHYEKAARLFGAAEVLLEILGYHPSPPDQAHHDEHVAATRDALSAAAFAARWAQGRAMTLEQAIEYSLQSEG